MAEISNRRCSIAVTVEELFTVCPCKEKYFDIVIRNSSGETVANGKVAGGDSAVFSLPCGGSYLVTAIGDANSSPRAQTRRVRCACGEAGGVTFIFTIYEPMCSKEIDPCCDPCHDHCHHHCHDHCHDHCRDHCCDDCCDGEGDCYQLTISKC